MRLIKTVLAHVIAGIATFFLYLLVFGVNVWSLVSNPFRKTKREVNWHLIRDLERAFNRDESEDFYHH